MKFVSPPLITALPMAFLACWSAMHCYTGKFGTVVGSYGIFVICGVELLLGLVIQVPHRIVLRAAIVIFVPLLCALSFSWAELAREIDPSGGSKGWGMFAFILFYIYGLIAFVIGLTGQWLVLTLLKL